jgi:serine/threonine protein kinase
MNNSTLQGTVRYSAPELFSSKQAASEKCDVYSLGITMWQLVMGKIPFGEDQNQMELIYQVSFKIIWMIFHLIKLF